MSKVCGVCTRRAVAVDVAQGFYHRHHGYYCHLLSCRVVASAYHVNADEGTHAIMDSHDAFHVIGDEAEPVLYGMETSLTTVSQLVGYIEMVVLAQLQPILLLRLWQYKDNLKVSRILPKPFEGSHKYRLSPNGKKLLGYVAAHTKTLATCYYDYIIHYES